MGKEGLTTKEAFLELLDRPDVHEKFGISETTVRVYKTRLKNNGPIAVRKMEEMLEQAGWKVVQEKLWNNSPTLVKTTAVLPEDERILYNHNKKIGEQKLKNTMEWNEAALKYLVEEGYHINENEAKEEFLEMLNKLNAIVEKNRKKTNKK